MNHMRLTSIVGLLSALGVAITISYPSSLQAKDKEKEKDSGKSGSAQSSASSKSNDASKDSKDSKGNSSNNDSKNTAGKGSETRDSGGNREDSKGASSKLDVGHGRDGGLDLGRNLFGRDDKDRDHHGNSGPSGNPPHVNPNHHQDNDFDRLKGRLLAKLLYVIKHFKDRHDEKVTVCHKGHPITISCSALHAHLAHGDTIGSCDVTPTKNH